ncbi:MAG TPA: multicopper oxidase domain-containing protein [Actinomycetota bacterium]|nr:multicopper oxidase domain-containing protein [Actinomycetota bacterium]
MRRFNVAAAAALLGLLLVASACTSESGSGSGGGATEAASAASFDVSLTDQLKIVPEMIDAPADTPLTFNVTNDGATQHTFAIEAGDQTYETPLLEGGATATLEVPALAEGDYTTVCTVPGHADAGMTGMLMVSGSGATQASGDASVTPDHSTMTAQEMADSHAAGVEAFVKQLTDGPNTEGQGNQPLRPELDGDVKVFNLTVSQIQWEIESGKFVDAMAFNDQVPGPQITVYPGDQVRFFVQNQMDQPFALHFHGLTVPNEMDGVPYVTQDPIMPGKSWTYEFTIKDPPGMYVYHSHFNSAEQVDAGLYGALIVAPRSGWSSVYGVDPAVESTMFIGDGTLGYNLNGKGFPSTLPIIAKKDQWVLIHMANDGGMLHPMHLHGFHFQVVGEDGFPLAAQNRYMADTLVIAPGSRFDILVKADQPGVWAFHCHILNHVEGPQGMFGMVTALIVQ